MASTAASTKVDRAIDGYDAAVDGSGSDEENKDPDFVDVEVGESEANEFVPPHLFSGKRRGRAATLTLSAKQKGASPPLTKNRRQQRGQSICLSGCSFIPFSRKTIPVEDRAPRGSTLEKGHSPEQLREAHEVLC